MLKLRIKQPVHLTPRKPISGPKRNSKVSSSKSQKCSKLSTIITGTKPSNSTQKTETKSSPKPKCYKPNPKPNSAKPVIQQRIGSGKIEKSKSDSALNETKGKTLRATSAQSNISRASSSFNSRSSSKSSTPAIKKKKPKQTFTKKDNFDSLGKPDEEPSVVYVNYRHQVNCIIYVRLIIIISI